MATKNICISVLIVALVSACGDNDPKAAAPKMITKVTLTFAPPSGSPVVVTATDPDGDGVQGIKTDGEIVLAKSTEYTLTLQLINGLADPGDRAYNVTNEVEREGDEHMLFFSWTGNAFQAPKGDGNIDNRNDPVDYSASMDENGFPLGLITKWKSAGITTEGANFRVLLKHQPALKSQTSTSKDGETDLDITFELSVD